MDRSQSPRKPTQLAGLGLDCRAAEVFEQIIVSMHTVERRTARLSLVQVREVRIDEVR